MPFIVLGMFGLFSLEHVINGQAYLGYKVPAVVIQHKISSGKADLLVQTHSGSRPINFIHIVGWSPRWKTPGLFGLGGIHFLSFLP